MIITAMPQKTAVRTMKDIEKIIMKNKVKVDNTKVVVMGSSNDTDINK